MKNPALTWARADVKHRNLLSWPYVTCSFRVNSFEKKDRQLI